MIQRQQKLGISSFCTICILCLVTLLPVDLFAQKYSKLRQYNYPELPVIKEEKSSLGYAGMMGGMHQGVLIAAGGANFPNAAPWEGGAKVYYDHIFAFTNGRWQILPQRLPRPVAYGASVVLKEGVLFIGGENESQTTKKVFLLSLDKTTTTITLTDYPELPQPLAYTTAVVEQNYVYVAGGKNQSKSVNTFYRLDLNQKKKWEKLADFPGLPRALHTAVIQETREAKKLFLIGGRNQIRGQKSTPLSDFVSYDLKKKKWQSEGSISIHGKPQVWMGASATSMGSMHILLFGGSDEVLFNQLETLGLKINSRQNSDANAPLVQKRDSLLVNHPGFSNKIFSYNTITEKWFVYDSLPDKLPVTSLSFMNEKEFYIISGEIAPGVRTPKVQKIEITNSDVGFGLLNYAVLAIYLLISFLIGASFFKKQKSTQDYFKGGGRIPWWAAGLSVFGTLLSAITFMAIPAKAFITDWSFFLLNMTAILITPVIAIFFIPYFNQLNLKTAYEYLEERFNYLARAFGSLSFILFQLGRIGIVLLLPSLAITIVSGIPVETSILLMGVLCILYTALGGIEAVIWTDVLQVVVLLGGSILAVFWIFNQTNASLGEMIAYASSKEKFNIINMDFNFTEATFWVVFVGGLASALVTQGTDQTIVQRYLTSKNSKDAQKTLYTNAFLTLPASILFFGIGTLLFLFYSELPTRLSPVISNNDSIFPWYIVKELPYGLSGLLVAGIFSSAMSSISSSLNSVATAYCNDFHQRFYPKLTDKKLLKIARITTVLTGFLGVVLALWMAHSNIKSLWDQFYRFLGLFTGGLGGMFLLGILTKKANATGTLMGLAFSALLIWYISVFTEISFLMYTFFGLSSCFIFGYLFSIIFKSKNSL